MAKLETCKKQKAERVFLSFFVCIRVLSTLVRRLNILTCAIRLQNSVGDDGSDVVGVHAGDGERIVFCVGAVIATKFFGFNSGKRCFWERRV